MNNPLILVDSNCLAYRAFHSKGHLSYDNRGSGVIFGFLEAFVDIAIRFNTCDFLFAWDSSKSLRRLKVYPNYKIKRQKKRQEKTPAEKKELYDAYNQFDELRTYVLPTLGFKKNVLRSGYEGDDIIGYVCKHYPEVDKVIVSNDHDMLQCLNKDTTIFNPSTKKLITKKDFKKKYGIEPSAWNVVLAMKGCSTDEIPGIQGIGEDTAIKYLLGELNPKSKAYNKIQESANLIAKYVELTTIPFDDKVNYDDCLTLEYMKPCVLNKVELERIKKQYGFKSFDKNYFKDKWNKLFDICADNLIPF